MRDPKRIKPLLEEIEKYWMKWPDLRLGQLLVIMAGKQDSFYMEDDDLYAQLVSGVGF
jgi:hypothetical protein